MAPWSVEVRPALTPRTRANIPSSWVRFAGFTTVSAAPCQSESGGCAAWLAAARHAAAAPPSRTVPRMHWIAASGVLAHRYGPPATAPTQPPILGAAQARLHAIHA